MDYGSRDENTQAGKGKGRATSRAKNYQTAAESANAREVAKKAEQNRINDEKKTRATLEARRQQALLGYVRVDIRKSGTPVAIEKSRVNTRPIMNAHISRLRDSMDEGRVQDHAHPLRIMARRATLAIDVNTLPRTTADIGALGENVERVRWKRDVARAFPPSMLAGAHRREASIDLIARTAELLRQAEEDHALTEELRGKAEVWTERYTWWIAEVYDEDVLMQDKNMDLRAMIAANSREPAEGETTDEGFRSAMLELSAKALDMINEGKLTYEEAATEFTSDSLLVNREMTRDLVRTGWVMEMIMAIFLTQPRLTENAWMHPGAIRARFLNVHGRMFAMVITEGMRSLRRIFNKDGGKVPRGKVLRTFQAVRKNLKEQQDWDRRFAEVRAALNEKYKGEEVRDERKAKLWEWKDTHKRPLECPEHKEWQEMRRMYELDPAPNRTWPVMQSEEVAAALDEVFEFVFGRSVPDERKNDNFACVAGEDNLDKKKNADGEMEAPPILAYLDGIDAKIAEILGSEDTPNEIKGMTERDVSYAQDTIQFGLAMWACEMAETGMFLGLPCLSFLVYWGELLDEIEEALVQFILWFEPAIIAERQTSRDGWRDFSQGLYMWCEKLSSEIPSDKRGRVSTNDIFRLLTRSVFILRTPYFFILQSRLLQHAGPALHIYKKKPALEDILAHVNEFDVADPFYRIMGWNPEVDQSQPTRLDRLFTDWLSDYERVVAYYRLQRDRSAAATKSRTKAGSIKKKTRDTAVSGFSLEEKPAFLAKYPAAHVMFASAWRYSGTHDVSNLARRRFRPLMLEALRALIFSARAYYCKDVEEMRSIIRRELSSLAGLHAFQLWEDDLFSVWNPVPAIDFAFDSRHWSDEPVSEIVKQIDKHKLNFQRIRSVTDLYNSIQRSEFMFEAASRNSKANDDDAPKAKPKKKKSAAAAADADIDDDDFLDPAAGQARKSRDDRMKYVEFNDALDNLINLARVNIVALTQRPLIKRSLKLKDSDLPHLPIVRPRLERNFDVDIAHSPENVIMLYTHLGSLIRRRHQEVSTLNSFKDSLDAMAKEAEDLCDDLPADPSEANALKKKIEDARIRLDGARTTIESSGLLRQIEDTLVKAVKCTEKLETLLDSPGLFDRVLQRLGQSSQGHQQDQAHAHVVPEEEQDEITKTTTEDTHKSKRDKARAAEQAVSEHAPRKAALKTAAGERSLQASGPVQDDIDMTESESAHEQAHEQARAGDMMLDQGTQDDGFGHGRDDNFVPQAGLSQLSLSSGPPRKKLRAGPPPFNGNLKQEEVDVVGGLRSQSVAPTASRTNSNLHSQSAALAPAAGNKAKRKREASPPLHVP